MRVWNIHYFSILQSYIQKLYMTSVINLYNLQKKIPQPL